MPTNSINHHNNTEELEQTTLQHTNEQSNSLQTTGKNKRRKYQKFGLYHFF